MRRHRLSVCPTQCLSVYSQMYKDGLFSACLFRYVNCTVIMYSECFLCRYLQQGPALNVEKKMLEIFFFWIFQPILFYYIDVKQSVRCLFIYHFEEINCAFIVQHFYTNASFRTVCCTKLKCVKRFYFTYRVSHET